ncbi:MAG: hypoxanthine-guanine phosphoribosyltransferase, partial [Frankiaceae bacterium]|nr:hypoxanthine-guanine phosphoribosyltransferase [Arenimonas sp.]
MANDLALALRNSDRLFDEIQIEVAIARIAVDIRMDYTGERPLFLTLMHGGMLFASRLSLELGIDVEFDYLHATRYRGALTGSGLAWLHRPATPLEGRRVLIADDILDEGHTLKAVRNWCEDQGAADVRIAVMCVKNHDRRIDEIDADYI